MPISIFICAFTCIIMTFSSSLLISLLLCSWLALFSQEEARLHSDASSSEPSFDDVHILRLLIGCLGFARLASPLSTPAISAESPSTLPSLVTDLILSISCLVADFLTCCHTCLLCQLSTMDGTLGLDFLSSLWMLTLMATLGTVNWSETLCLDDSHNLRWDIQRSLHHNLIWFCSLSHVGTVAFRCSPFPCHHVQQLAAMFSQSPCLEASDTTTWMTFRLSSKSWS